MFLTFELVFTIFMLAAEKHRATYLAPMGIGLALFVAEMAGVRYTGGKHLLTSPTNGDESLTSDNSGSLNPARSFAPCVALTSFPTYHWIYWVGPLLGSLLAVFFYRYVPLPPCHSTCSHDSMSWRCTC